MSYTYINGCYAVTTGIRNGFTRFHKCNAQDARFGITYDGSHFTPVRFEVWQFVSYNTEIMQVVYDTKYDSWTVAINERIYDYSPTTSRQINRWIREHSYEFPFTPYDIDMALQECHGITPDVATVTNDNVTYDIRSYDSLMNVWR